MGLGEGAGDDRCTLSTSFLRPFWKRVLCLLSLWLKTGDMELLCECFGVGKEEDCRMEESKLSDGLPVCFRYSSLESSDDF